MPQFNSLCKKSERFCPALFDRLDDLSLATLSILHFINSEKQCINPNGGSRTRSDAHNGAGGDLNKALIRYLEDRLVAIARECGHDSVLTKSTYRTKLKESQIASMEEFIDNVKALLSALGYRVLTPAPKPTENTAYLFCKGSGADGKGFVSSGGFAVIAGSRISDHIVESLKTHGRAYLRLREKLINEGLTRTTSLPETTSSPPLLLLQQ